MHVDKDLIARAVGPERFERGRELAWSLASTCGMQLRQTDEQKTAGVELYDIVDDVVEAAFAGARTDAEKLRAVCTLYEDFPSYTILSELSTAVTLAALPAGEMTFYYGFLGAMLSAPVIELAQPASYVLWVDFFEDAATVDAAWSGVCSGIVSDEGWRRLLATSGPVPERLKGPLIERFAVDPAFHEAIFLALCAGVFDVFGQVSRATVERMLPLLEIDRTQPRYGFLVERLADPTPIAFAWQLAGAPLTTPELRVVKLHVRPHGEVPNDD